MKYLLDTNVIASIAGANDLILVTRNIVDFKPFSKLNLENWHSA